MQSIRRFALVVALALCAMSPAFGQVAEFCYGDGSSGSCPCSNDGNVGTGCQHSASLSFGLTGQGAYLSALNFDPNPTPPTLPSVFLRIQYLNPNASVTVIGLRSSGTQSPAPFGDGLACIDTSNVTRIFSAQSFGGSGGACCGQYDEYFQTVTHGAGSGTFHYQVWYRNTATFCTADQDNISSGLESVW